VGVAEKLEELQQHHNHKDFLFLTVMLLFAQRKTDIFLISTFT
jgi:hypothetical protein